MSDKAKTPPRKKRSPTARKQTSRTARAPEGALDRTFVDALSQDFVRHGASAIAALREKDPVTYMKLCAATLPKQVIESLDPLETLSDDELRRRAQELAAKAGYRLDPDDRGAGATEDPKPA